LTLTNKKEPDTWLALRTFLFGVANLGVLPDGKGVFFNKISRPYQGMA
jgi:hypothetical protein